MLLNAYYKFRNTFTNHMPQEIYKNATVEIKSFSKYRVLLRFLATLLKYKTCLISELVNFYLDTF